MMVISSGGSPTVSRTITIVTSPALNHDFLLLMLDLRSPHLGYPRRSDARRCGGDGDGAYLAQRQVQVVNLGGRDGL